MIRKAVITDIKEIQQLVNAYAEKDKMLKRSLNDLYEHIRDYFVYVDKNGKIGGCCAVHIVWDYLAEIKALAVAEEYTGKGIARQLVNSCIKEAKSLGVKQLFTLTYIPDFFLKFDFILSKRENLPHKVWRECIDCPKFPNCNETALEIEI